MTALNTLKQLVAASFILAGLLITSANAQESPYFITYDHHLEEPGNLEIEANGVLGLPKGGNNFLGSSMEFEYGAKSWWTTELYLDGQSTFDDSTIFTGWRWENRFRPFMGEHAINPVLYVEFEDINGADKALKEIVGLDSGRDVARNSETRRERQRELETKLILSSNFKGWNVSENFIAEKNLKAGEPWEFGYAIGVSRPLALAASPKECRFCRENFQAGIELFGGLGNTDDLTMSGTSHYLGAVVAWKLPEGVTFRIEPTWGLTSNSYRALMRFGVSYEITGFGRRLRNLFR
ncbi:MAG: hypothetical protein ACREAC_00310 [Blastocatellia bacterium]